MNRTDNYRHMIMGAVPPTRNVFNGEIYGKMSIEYAREAIRKLKDADDAYAFNLKDDYVRNVNISRDYISACLEELEKDSQKCYDTEDKSLLEDSIKVLTSLDSCLEKIIEEN
ncbi:hypothetical protein HN992_01665 [Candidatus Woesearchaeota archaeon]|nr:hypothetical protein [Candidatus Woesearchaeota archaeon]MBT3438620.1 hypothetical protein [Candidatus Woesearchaeota archaeon]MBT4058482.1 hypothetical protein [Candidatus Woesearchaeota archaeon]MBT4207305.1 hypothetical protein [Candidatus Woesearchaeota archaeon]MBT4730962.1 hypothetical protein [Candidatus Woesearchaeota archaeon]